MAGAAIRLVEAQGCKMDDHLNARIPFISVPTEVKSQYHALQDEFTDQRAFDGSGLRRVVVELQSPRGTLTIPNGRLTVKDCAALVALRVRWWLAGFLLLRNGLAESVYASDKSLLERHERLVTTVEELRGEIEALRSQIVKQGAEPNR